MTKKPKTIKVRYHLKQGGGVALGMLKKLKKQVKKLCRHKWEVTGENDCAYCGYTEFFTCEKCGAEKEGKDGKIYQ